MKTSTLLGLLAAGAGVLYLATRSSSTSAPAEKSSAPRCIGTTAALTAWANAHGVALLFLPQESTPPTSTELVDSGYEPDNLVVVLRDTSFWIYYSGVEQPVRRSDLRSDYCATVT